MDNEMIYQNVDQARIARPDSTNEKEDIYPVDYPNSDKRQEVQQPPRDDYQKASKPEPTNPPISAKNNKIGKITIIVLIVLISAVVIALTAFAVLYFEAQMYQKEIEHQLEQMNIAFDTDNSTYAASFRILGRLAKIRTDMQMLKAKEENASSYKFQAQTYLKQIENEVNRMAISANVDSTTNTSERDVLGFQIQGHLSKIQTTVQEMKTKNKKELEICTDAFSRFSIGWELKGQNVYYFSKEKKNWQDAENFCMSKKSHLTSIKTSEEQKYLSAKRDEYWIGLTDAGSEGNWTFADGSEFLQSSPRFWAAGEPNNWNKKEHCAVTQPSGKWNDLDCSTQMKWICKKSLTV